MWISRDPPHLAHALAADRPDVVPSDFQPVGIGQPSFFARPIRYLRTFVAGAAYEDGDLVFCNELGVPIYPQALTGMFRAKRKDAGITTGTLHILRHTAATLALTATPPVPLHIVAGRLGDDPTTLLSTYAHPLPRSDAQAAETVAAILDDKPMTKAAA